VIKGPLIQALPLHLQSYLDLKHSPLRVLENMKNPEIRISELIESKMNEIIDKIIKKMMQ